MVGSTTTTTVTAAPVGPEGQPTDRVSVGPGAVESSIRQVVRTLDGRVYIVAPDDDGAQRNDFTTPTIMRMYRATTTGIPKRFLPVDEAHSPRVEAPKTMSGGDARLDRAGVIHLVYYRTDQQATIYQTFSTVTDTWGRGVGREPVRRAGRQPGLRRARVGAECDRARS